MMRLLWFLFALLLARSVADAATANYTFTVPSLSLSLIIIIIIISSLCIHVVVFVHVIDFKKLCTATRT